MVADSASVPGKCQEALAFHVVHIVVVLLIGLRFREWIWWLLGISGTMIPIIVPGKVPGSPIANCMRLYIFVQIYTS